MQFFEMSYTKKNNDRVIPNYLPAEEIYYFIRTKQNYNFILNEWKIEGVIIPSLV